ncbi:MAG: recombinase RecA [Candidatus Lokiarchaeota archaeon]|nr:recombinase RecA [Candidatus Lokiarchaeota archaeon]
MSKETQALEEAKKVIAKKYGESSLMELTKDNKVDIETISIGVPSIDYILGGGIPKGRIIEIYGPEASGKTTLALQMLGKCQSEEKKVAFIDVENAFDPNYAKAMGVDLDNLFLNQPNSGEEALDIVEKLAQTGAISIIVLDSIAQLVPMAVLGKEIGGSANIGTTARLLSQSLPRISNALSRTNTILVCINQIRMKIGVMYGNPEVSTGGLALKFASTQRIEIRGRKAEERNGQEGCPVSIRVKKNKIAPPFRSTECFLIFGKGFDIMSDLVETAMAKNIITKSGSWYEYEKIKVQGLEAMVDALKEDKKLFEKLKKEMKSQ